MKFGSLEERKKALENEISSLLCGFENETGVKVEDITISTKTKVYPSALSGIAKGSYRVVSAKVSFDLPKVKTYLITNGKDNYHVTAKKIRSMDDILLVDDEENTVAVIPKISGFVVLERNQDG